MDKINNIGLSRLLTSVYDFDGFNEQEVWCRIAQKINIIIEHFNYLDKKIENEKENNKAKFDYLLGEGLTEAVAKIILEKIKDGTIGELINGTLLKDINDKVDNFIIEINNRLDNIMVDVKSFGAKGDGVNNDSDKIQEFLNFCSLNQVKGRVSAGIYILDKQLNISSNTHLIFDDGAEFKQMHEFTMINIQNNSHTEYNGYKNIKIENGNFNCNGSVINDPMNCFFIQHATNVEFLNCTFKNVRSFHALDINGSKDIRVINCKFLNTYDNTGKNDREAIQIDISAPAEGEIGICWDYTPTINVTIENCYFGKDDVNALNYTTAIGSHNIRYGKYYDNIQIRNCIIDGCLKYAINGWKWNNCILENNVIQNCGGGIKLDTPHRNAVSGNDTNGIYKGLENSYGNVIENNLIKDVSSEGIFLRGKYIETPSEGESNSGLILRTKVSNNTITQKNSSFPSIVLLNSSECIVTNNSIGQSSTDGIRCYSSFKNIIYGNKIMQSGNYGISISNATLTGTDSSGRCDNNIVENNTIESSYKCAIFLTGGANSGSVKNNICKSCNTLGDSGISIINVSANTNDVTITENKIIDTDTFKNSIFVTNTCNRILVSNNICNAASENKYFNESINGLLINNI